MPARIGQRFSNHHAAQDYAGRGQSQEQNQENSIHHPDPKRQTEDRNHQRPEGRGLCNVPYLFQTARQTLRTIESKQAEENVPDYEKAYEQDQIAKLDSQLEEFSKA